MKNEIKEYKDYIKQQAADPDVDKKSTCTAASCKRQASISTKGLSTS